MSLAIVFEEEVFVVIALLRVVCAYSPQGGKLTEDKYFFNEELSGEWTTHYRSELIIGMRYINVHIG